MKQSSKIADETESSCSTAETSAAIDKNKNYPSKAAAAEAVDWRTQKRTVNERLVHLLETGECADIHFLVGNTGEEQELISTHKLLLYAGSPVFEAQLNHGNSGILTQKGTKENPIEVPDVRPDGFRAMIHFFYTDCIGSSVNKQNVMDIYGAAKKYMVVGLVDLCRHSLIDGTNLGEDNVLSVLKHAQRHEDKELINFCWSFVDKNAKAVLNSEEFLLLNKADLYELFGRDSLKANELFLFQSLHRWAINNCNANGREPTPENKRKAVGEAIYQIQIPRVSQYKFSVDIVPTGMLNEKDIIAVYLRYSGVNFDLPETSRQFPLNFRPYGRTMVTGHPMSCKKAKVTKSLWMLECYDLVEHLTDTFLEQATKNNSKDMNNLAYDFLEKLRRTSETIGQYQSPEAFLKELASFLYEQRCVVIGAESRVSKTCLAILGMHLQLNSKQQPILAKYINRRVADEAESAVQVDGQKGAAALSASLTFWHNCDEDIQVAGPSTSTSVTNSSSGRPSTSQVLMKRRRCQPNNSRVQQCEHHDD